MATAARFGRLPKTAPSLTSTIVALQAQYQAVRESNIVDAWKNGGLFEGKKVTDDMVLKWFKGRRDELSPDDPKWDYYNNQVAQYTFSIANSKMELRYGQHKVNDAEMAGFYHQWAGKLPPDSEAYRAREKLAAQYADRGKQRAAAAGRAAADRAYNNTISGDYKKEFAYDTIEEFITVEAHRRGILEKGETLANIDPASGDGARINALWDEIATSPQYAGDRRWYTRQIKEHGNPHFNGDFSHDGFNGQKRVKEASVHNRIITARKAGRTGDVTTFKADRDSVRATTIITGGYDATEDYENAHNEWHDVVTDPSSTPLEIERANEKYKGQLTDIHARLQKHVKPNESDQRLGWLTNELLNLNGDPKPYVQWGGGASSNAPNWGGAGATTTADGVNKNKQDMANLLTTGKDGKPGYVLTRGDPNTGKPVATTDRNYVAAPWVVVPATDMPDHTVYVSQNDPDPRAGRIVTAVTPQPIFAAANVPGTGAAKGTTVTKKGPAPIGYGFTMPDGVTGYKYKDDSGNWWLTPDNPFVKVDPVSGVETPYTVLPGSGPSGGKQDPATINVGDSYAVPAGSVLTGPNYRNPVTNPAMTRVGKSGYSMWLIGSDPKNRTVFAQTPEQIYTSLDMETPAGADHDAVLGGKVQDADMHRSVYIGDSTSEQQRIRQNALTGTPNPVPLNIYGVQKGVVPAGQKQDAWTEAGAYARLTGGGRDQIIEDMREANRGDLNGSRYVPVQSPGQTDMNSLTRKYQLAPTPVSPLQAAATAPTSLGNAATKGVTQTLLGFLNMATGKTPTPAVPTTVAPPPTRPTILGGATDPLAAALAQDAKKPPKAAPTPKPVQVQSSPQRHTIYDQNGDLVGYHTGGKYGTTII